MRAGDLVRFTWPDGDQETGIFQKEERGFAVLSVNGNRVVGCLSSLDRIEVLKNSENIKLGEYNKYMGIKEPIDWRWIGFILLVVFILIVA
jgi:hypothetical protein